MKISELKKQAIEVLGEQFHALEVDLWCAHVLGKTKEWVFMNEHIEMTEEAELAFCNGIEKLREGKPLSQLTGVKEFYGLEFVVDENVLIPRPETELVVDLAKEFIEKNYNGGGENLGLSSQVVKVLDVGTGSGCILLALASVVPDMIGVGSEISEKALMIANINAKKLGLADKVEFRQADLLVGLEGEFDVLLTNLPYIGRKKFNFVAKDVADFEPEVALFGGDDGLDLYRELFKQLLELSWRPALMIGEFGFGQEEEMRRILESNFGSVESNLEKKLKFEIIPDLAGIPRVFVVNFI